MRTGDPRRRAEIVSGSQPDDASGRPRRSRDGGAGVRWTRRPPIWRKPAHVSSSSFRHLAALVWRLRCLARQKGPFVALPVDLASILPLILVLTLFPIAVAVGVFALRAAIVRRARSRSPIATAPAPLPVAVAETPPPTP